MKLATVISNENNWGQNFYCEYATMVFCYQNYSDLVWEKIVLGIEKTFWNSRLKAKNFAKILKSLEQFIQTVKG